MRSSLRPVRLASLAQGRRPALLVLAVAALVATWSATPPRAQSPGFPSAKNGEWPQYGSDVRGTRYSPADQITGENFGKLEVAWRFKTDNLGTFPEDKLEGTPLMVKGGVYTTDRKS